MHLPKSVAFTSGKPNRAQILYYVEPKISSFKNVKHQLEIRGSGHQSLLPPSSHPKTTGYYWLHSPRSVEIARINSDRLKVLRPIRKPKTNYGNNHDLLQAQRLLWQIHPKYADDYWHWLSIGMALHSVDFSLLEDWDTWSQHSKKYKPKECAYKWNSFKKQGYTIGTLYYYANLSRVKLIANNVALTPALP